MDGDGETMSPLPAPRPRVFPVSGISSTPRCGHTLTALAGPDGDLQGARLVLFGEASAGPLSRPSPIAISTCSTRAGLASCQWSAYRQANIVLSFLLHRRRRDGARGLSEARRQRPASVARASKLWHRWESICGCLAACWLSSMD